MRVAGSDGAHRPGSGRQAFAVAAGAALALSAVIGLPGAATAAPANPADHVTHPQLDWAGSTVAAHEGGNVLTPGTVSPRTTTPGMDVSAYQGSVDWAAAWNNGAKFAYVKATESTTYTNPDFSQQYNGSYNAGMIRGAYHFATPDTSDAKDQADYFVAHGGGWSADGKTLPPMLDIEYNPYGAECYGKSQADMVTWIRNFVNEVHTRTSRWAVIYSTTDWWKTCTGNNSSFGADDPLFVANYNGTADPLPAGWSVYTIWQYADSGTFPGDQDRFNGDPSRVKALADG